MHFQVVRHLVLFRAKSVHHEINSITHLCVHNTQTGFPFPCDFASVIPAIIASMSFPLECQSRPNQKLHLARILPIGKTSSVVPSICFPLNR
jgi:hypothetical protein